MGSPEKYDCAVGTKVMAVCWIRDILGEGMKVLKVSCLMKGEKSSEVKATLLGRCITLLCYQRTKIDTNIDGTVKGQD